MAPRVPPHIAAASPYIGVYFFGDPCLNRVSEIYVGPEVVEAYVAHAGAPEFAKHRDGYAGRAYVLHYGGGRRHHHVEFYDTRGCRRDLSEDAETQRASDALIEDLYQWASTGTAPQWLADFRAAHDATPVDTKE